MLRQASEFVAPAASPEPVHKVNYYSGCAENTGLADSSVRAVLCAQSFHWFKSEEALSEFYRILSDAGWVILIWNERDEVDNFTQAYGEIIRSWPETASIELPRAIAGQPLMESRFFTNKKRVDFANEQILDQKGLIGRAFSASYAPKENQLRALSRQRLIDLFKAYERDNSVILKYLTSVYVGQKKLDRRKR
jgi:SAM-dependent methyltransferase